MKLDISATVLLVDDNAVQAVIRQAILRRAGYFVITALNPMRALEQLQRDEFPSPISVVITDHVMPGMSGARFVRALREIQPQLPVMVISGLEEAKSEYTELEVLFLVKPVSPDLLLAHLREMVPQRRVGAA